jgi:hypothetical protein
MSTKPEFYVTDNFFSNGGAVVAGPFSTHDDAFVARVGIERVAKSATYYVDELTTPPVDLPTEPTLGWAVANFGPRLVMTPRTGRKAMDVRDSDLVDWDLVTAFTPVAAVPTEALDELREIAGRCNATYPKYEQAIHDFLDAVDKAAQS